MSNVRDYRAWLSSEGGSGSVSSSQPQSNFSVFLVQHGSRENCNLAAAAAVSLQTILQCGLGIVPGHLALSLVLPISNSPESFSLSF